MRHVRTLTVLALSGAIVATSACMTNSYSSRRPLYQPAVDANVGLLGAYLAGDVVGGQASRSAKVVRANIAPLQGAEVAAYMARQEADLRRQTVGTGV